MRRVNVGFRLWLLFLVFVLSWFGAFLAFSDSDRIALLLEANPQYYLNYVEQTILFLVTPSIIELAFIAITSMSSSKFWVEVLSWWPVLAAYGILFLLFSSFGLYLTVYEYSLTAGNEHLQSPLLIIYASAAAGFSIWALAGFLFLVTPLRKRRKRSAGALG